MCQIHTRHTATMASELYRRWQTLHLLYGSEKIQFKCINSPLFLVFRGPIIAPLNHNDLRAFDSLVYTLLPFVSVRLKQYLFTELY